MGHLLLASFFSSLISLSFAQTAPTQVKATGTVTPQPTTTSQVPYNSKSPVTSVVPLSTSSVPASSSTSTVSRPSSFLSSGSGSADTQTLSGADSGSCAVDCAAPSAPPYIVADISSDFKSCMCVVSASGVRDCFPMDVGHNYSGGNELSQTGFGKMTSEAGGKYTTKDGDGSASLSQKDDGDACNPGIGSDTNAGKWIHKAHYNGSCQASGSYMTAGCLAVSCSDWPAVKAACNAHAQIHVCQGPNAIPPGELNRYNPSLYSSSLSGLPSTRVEISGGANSPSSNSSGITVPYNSKRGSQ
jgi:hypothetical protein